VNKQHPRQSRVVLKFGSSIFANPASYGAAVTEIRRYLDEGSRVIAVVSAMLGETDKLYGWSRSAGSEPDPYAVADLVATGELQSSLLLRVWLLQAGIPAVVARPQEIGLLAEGPAHDSDPVALDLARLEALLEHHPVAIVPGFIGCDQQGRTVLFGRGGSDDSALFLAHQLQAGCILLKDVDGVFEYDPALPGPPPRVFSRISWDHALEVAGVLVQPKAIRFAQQRGLSFAVRSIGSTAGTWIGPYAIQFAPVAVAG
jgi:homoserine dehydrogenase